MTSAAIYWALPRRSGCLRRVMNLVASAKMEPSRMKRIIGIRAFVAVVLAASLYLSVRRTELFPSFERPADLEVTHSFLSPLLLATVRDSKSKEILFCYDIDHG